jgi:hypothetical protein
MPPLRVQVCIRQRDALLRRSAPQDVPLSRAHLKAMIWEHRAMDLLYRSSDDGWGSWDAAPAGLDDDDLIPF